MTVISRVIPAILTNDPAALRTMVRLVEGFTDYVQFDVMDGNFVPSRSITAADLAQLPMQLQWEVHLMVRQPQNYLAQFQQAGAKKVIFHYEATPAPHEVVAAARKHGLEVGLALNPETPVAAILPLTELLDSVLFMSVTPGYYGSPFLPQVMDKVAEFRRHYPDFELGMDGGIKESNVAMIARSGVNYIYVGSAIFLQADPAACFRHLTALAQETSTEDGCQ